jgi:Zn-dependent peptidase ImmA (M78 family)
MTKLTEINPNILEWAVNYSSQGTALSVRFPKLKSWINKDDFPTVRQLEKFSKATSVPFGYFFLEKPPIVTLSIPFFRTIKEKEEKSFSPELLDTVRIIEQRRDWLNDYLFIKGADILPFVGAYKKNNDVKKIAESIRTELQLGENWAEKHPNWNDALNFLMEKTEDAGINVVRNGVVGNNTHRKLDYKEFRGFVLVDEYAPFVFINGADFKSAQMFTLAHELAHIWLGSSAIFDLRQMLPAENETEIICDKVAAEFLVPENYLKENWKSFKQTENPYHTIASAFKVSEIVAARRVLDLKLISKEEFFNFYNEYTSKKRKSEKKDGGDFYNTQPFRIGKRFASAVITAANEGSLLYRDAYRLTGLNASSFQEFENRMK